MSATNNAYIVKQNIFSLITYGFVQILFFYVNSVRFTDKRTNWQ